MARAAQDLWHDEIHSVQLYGLDKDMISRSYNMKYLINMFNYVVSKFIHARSFLKLDPFNRLKIRVQANPQYAPVSSTEEVKGCHLGEHVPQGGRPLFLFLPLLLG